ncbi:MAG: trypsin-like peptidase domain-containing protein [Burkholderiales bacterium]|nr:trypsin-like peptidase domain-containing protein [Burkholderiales bacterium]
MRRLWLLFAQTVTVGLALWFIVTTLKPEWVRHSFSINKSVSLSSSATLIEAPINSAQNQNSYHLAAKRAMPSVVNINATRTGGQSKNPMHNDPFFKRFFGDQIKPRSERPSSSGSGVIMSPQGHILTNNHVIQGTDSIEVSLADGRQAQAKIIGTDPDTDLAVIQIDLKDLPAITLGHSDQASVGDVVLAIGNPFGVGQTVTMGIISALGRDSVGINTYENFIQTDAAVNPGNSGGALIDAAGNLLGINSAIYSQNGGSLGIGFAIPVSTIKMVMEAIITDGQVVRGYLGIGPEDITSEMAESFNIQQTKGSIIAAIVRGGPADQAGMKPGDICTEIDGKAFQNSREMMNRIASLKPNSKAKLKVFRQAKELSLEILVGKRPPFKSEE